MLTNSRTVSLALASSVSLVTLMFLTLVPSADVAVMLVAGAMSFSASFILVYVVMEFLVFRGVNEVYDLFERLKEDETHIELSKKGLMLQPMQRINRELVDFAAAKEEEIDKLKKLEAYRREFIADVSHELKTPLFAAQGYVLTLLDGAAEDENMREKFLKKAAKSLNGLDDLIQDLLTLSQIESGVIKMQFEDFDIRELVLDLFDQLESKASKKAMTLKLKISPEHELEGVWVHADHFRISQVMVNLLTNGIKYGHDDGWVEVEMIEKDKIVNIIISDNGPGIPEKDLKRIFERFYRVEKSRSKKQGGSGLGLAIVKHILEHHNSTIEVKSEINKGTQFEFSLPISQTA